MLQILCMAFDGNQLKPCILAFECFKALVPRVTATSLHSPTHLKLIYYSVGSLAFDKLTDTREPIRSAALDTIVELYVAIQESYESGGKDKYNAQGQLLNEFHKEILGHFECKAPKAREMMMDWARRILQLSYFPFDLILPSLIKSLQDANESVRTKCKETLLELYTEIPNQRQNVLLELKNQTIRSSILDPFMRMLNDIDVKCPYDGIKAPLLQEVIQNVEKVKMKSSTVFTFETEKPIFIDIYKCKRIGKYIGIQDGMFCR